MKVMPNAAGRAQRRAEVTRATVLGAARHVLAANGEHAFTLEAVADRADVAVQTIYNRIGNRSAVLVAVAEEALLESRQYMDAAYMSAGTVVERLRRVAEAYGTFARNSPHEFRILVEPPDEQLALQHIATVTRSQNAKLAAILREGMEEGVLRSDLDPELLSTMFAATLNGLLALAWRPGLLRATSDDIDNLLHAYLAALTDGMLTL
ncbi:TetR/AcrR family transcriptional regulator [Rhodococcus sp. NPDC057297]|uniref:TetR/AcrR family transcriptional regulator n=1 Tax=Rhodococcus sp. NPDC057297 TaxID=3346090 RepID=UPI00363A457F